MKAAAVVIGIVVLAFCARAAEVTFEVSVPPSTPAQAVVYVAGDFQGWRPGEAAWALERGSDGRWRRRATFPDGQPCSSSSRSAAGRPWRRDRPARLQNRRTWRSATRRCRWWLPPGPTAPPPRASTTGDVRRLDVPGFLDGRRVWVWLPPGYEDAPARRYPVLYLLDGQNIFDAATSFAGEWEVDESLARLVAAGEVEPLIAVAANGGACALRSTRPWTEPAWREATGGGGDTARHRRGAEACRRPRLRTLDGPAHTGLCGSSFGGLMALHAAYARPDVFGLPALSPSLAWAWPHAAGAGGGLATASRRAPVRRHGIA
ncbi:MAG: alpha/beta hydrolase [bacterium]|nr:alpha/beta hydrolase [bacterium]